MPSRYYLISERDEVSEVVSEAYPSIATAVAAVKHWDTAEITGVWQVGPGLWADVSGSAALLWIAAHKAEISDLADKAYDAGCESLCQVLERVREAVPPFVGRVHALALAIPHPRQRIAV